MIWKGGLNINLKICKGINIKKETKIKSEREHGSHASTNLFYLYALHTNKKLIVK